MKIGIVVDSTCDLKLETISRYQMEMVPLSIHFGDEVYLDREEIEGQEFFKKMEQSEKLPTTSQPSIGLFFEKYREMSNEYDAIISIHLSAKLSGTCESARMAAAQLNDLEVRVIDSRSATYGAGYLAVLAAQMIEDGKDLDEIISLLEEVRENITVFFTVNDLSYLQKGGRIGKAQAFLGSILNVYPILILPGSEGEILPLEKVRGKKKIFRRMEELILQETSGENNAWIAFLHGMEIDNARRLRETVTDQLIGKLNFKTDFNFVSSVLGSHVGPSVYGAVIIKGDFLSYEKGITQ